MTEYADPEKYFAISLSLSAVKRDDYEACEKALRKVRDEFSQGGSGISYESVRPGTVLNR
jgi:hypothetical protein